MDQRCRSGQQCVALTEDGPAITYKPLCQRCIDQLQSYLDRLPDIRKALRLWSGGLWGQSGEARVSTGKGEPPCPLNVGVVDQIDNVTEILYRVDGLRIADLIMQTNGPEWALEVRKAFRAADKTIGIQKHWSRRLTPCADCGQRALGSFAGEDLVRCSACGACTDLDEYQRNTLIRVSIEKKERI